MSIQTRPRSEAGELPDEPTPDLSVVDLARRVYALFYNKRFGLALILGLGVATLLGVLFPQAPAGVLDDPAQRALWLDSVRPRFRGWTEPLAAAGLFGVYSSVWFLAITVLLALSILACTAHRVPQLWTQATRPHTRVRDTFFDHARFAASTTVPLGTDAALERVKQRLHGRRFRTITEASGESVLVYADRNRFAPLGTVVAHLAFVLILAGVFVTSSLGLRLDDVTVPIGSTVDIGHGTGLSIQARSFTDTYHPDGSPADYVSDLVLVHDGAQVAQQEVRVNAPLRWGGYSINQSFFGIAADLTVTDATGATVFAQAIPLQYRTAEGDYSYGKATLDAQQLLVYVITPASGRVVPDIPAGQAQVEIYANGSDEPLAQQVLVPGQAVRIGDLEWSFVRERQFTGLMVSRDPGAPWVWAGCILLVLGTCWTMFWRHHRLWVRLVPEGTRTAVTLASPDRHDVTFENDLTGFIDALAEEPAPRR